MDRNLHIMMVFVYCWRNKLSMVLYEISLVRQEVLVVCLCFSSPQPMADKLLCMLLIVSTALTINSHPRSSLDF